MSIETTSADFLAFIPHIIEADWDSVHAPCLAGFPVNIVYAARIEGAGPAYATYVFDPGTFAKNEHSRQMRYRPTVDSNFSVLVVLDREGSIETFKYRGFRADLRSVRARFLHGYDSHYFRWVSTGRTWSLSLRIQSACPLHTGPSSGLPSPPRA